MMCIISTGRIAFCRQVEGMQGEIFAASPIASQSRCNRVPNEPIPMYGHSWPQCQSDRLKLETDRTRKKGLYNDHWAIWNAMRWIDAGHGVICHRVVSDGSDGARPLRWSHSDRTEMFLSDAHGRHLVHSSITLIMQSLNVPNDRAYILSKLLIALMGFPKLGAAFYTKTAHECTQRTLNELPHVWYVVSHFTPLDSGGLKGWLYLLSHPVIWGGIPSRTSKQMAVGKLKMIENILHMYTSLCSSLVTLDLLYLISSRNRKGAGYQLCPQGVVILATPNFDPYSRLWWTVWLIYLLMSTCSKLS